MQHLNFRHLEYFWAVTRDGSIARASESLHVTPQTISGQLKLLEESVGAPLFQRQGRGLVLTETGQVVKHYADEIFAVGAELRQAIRSGEGLERPVLDVGIVNSIPKLVAYRILAPALSGTVPQRLACTQNSLEELLAQLALHRLDMVVSDSPVPQGLGVKAYNHRLGESAIAFYGARGLAARYGGSFPRSLDGAPMLMPVRGSALRRELEGWFIARGIAPRVVGDFEDSALLKMFGAGGAGLFPAPSAIAAEIDRRYDARLVGIADGVSETYVAISPERRLKHAAVQEIIDGARGQLFSE